VNERESQDHTGRQFGAALTRNEDARLLTGRAQFVDDVDLPFMLHAALVRSPHAHALVRSIDTSAARARDGVVAVYTAADLGAFWQAVPLVVPPPPVPGLAFNQRTHTPLAKDKVRYVGEPVGIVIAESRYVAEDAVDDVVVEYEPIAVAADLAAAAQASAPQVHDGIVGNVAAQAQQRKGNYAAAAARAAQVIKRTFSYEHGMAQPMETRGCVASWDVQAQRLTAWVTTQAPTSLRNGLAALLGLSEQQVRVVAPFVGGGFGVKLLMYYPEDLLVPWASIQLGVPVKWIEDRGEHFLASTQERAQIHEAEIAVDADGRILGVKDVFLHDNGAYNPYGLTVPINAQCAVFGPYDVPNCESAFTAVFTNKPIVAPYRGAGRQYGVFVIERLLDIAARTLGIDVAEIRRRNFIPAHAFPYKNDFIAQDFTTLSYDSGNYPDALQRLLEAVDYERFVRVEQPALRAAGKCVGIGVVAYVEGTGIGPYEGARVQVQASGRVVVATGVGTQGQGHYTSFAQIAADRLGVGVRDVDVVTGDTDQFGWGAGTFASRGAVVAGNAVALAADAVREKIIRLASELFACAPAEIVIADGAVARGASAQRIALGDLARKANPMRGSVRPGTEPGLEATRYFGPESGTTASGAHAMIIEVDPQTLQIEIRKYVVVHDCGVVINPLIVEGQIHGGVAQGIGNAFYERIAFDAAAQPLNTTLADYLIPTSLDVPHMTLHHLVTPSRTNELGIKGVGEAGAIPVGALFAQALENALDLPALGLEIVDIPTSPSQLWELMHSDRGAAPQRSKSADPAQKAA
jgi:carbon-monoxide dehydrogenase large subunit